MFNVQPLVTPKIRSIKTLEPGLQLGADIYAKSGELTFRGNSHLTGQQLQQLSTVRMDKVITLEKENHFTFDSSQSPEWFSEFSLGIRNFITNRDTRNLLESSVETADLMRIFENHRSEFLNQFIGLVRGFEQQHAELRQTLMGRQEQDDGPHQTALREIIAGNNPELPRIEQDPGRFDQGLVNLWQLRDQLYDQLAEGFQELEPEIKTINNKLKTRNDLKSPSEAGREYLLGLRRTQVKNHNATPPLSDIKEEWVDEGLKPPAFDEGDWELGYITARVKQILENLLVRGVFMETAAQDLFQLIQEEVATGEELYRRLTFPLQGENYMLSHIVNVLIISLFLGKEAELEQQQRKELGIAGLFFDLGMLRIDPALWTRGFKPDQEDVDQIQQHPLHSAEWLQEIFYPFKQSTLNVIRQHHERLDESGYPQGLQADQLTFKTRLLIVADVYDAMSTTRPHRSAIHPDKIITYLKNRTNKFDSEVVDLLENTIGPYPPGTVVQLDSNEIGVSLGKGENPYAPKIKIVIDSAGRVFEEPETIDLAEDTGRKIAETIGSRNTPNALLKYMT